MGTTIHMEPEVVRETVRKFLLDLTENFEHYSMVAKKVRAIPWEGKDREAFISKLSAWEARAGDIIKEGIDLSKRVMREVDEWIGVDSGGRDRFANMKYVKAAPAIVSVGAAVINYKTIEEGNNAFQAFWIGLSYEERCAFIQKEYDKLAKEYNLVPAKVSFEDIEREGIAGYYSHVSRQIVIDKTNIMNDDLHPAQLINTLAHETRHQYQYNIIDNYNESGIVPEGMTERTILDWRNETENYISSERDMFGYYFQSIEVDARKFGLQYQLDYVSSGGWTSGSSSW